MTTHAFEPVSSVRRRLEILVKRHPLAAFITLAYAISWLSWLLMRLVDTGSFNGLFALGATGPALAAMIVSAVGAAEPSDAPTGRRWLVFGPALAVGMAILVLSRLYAASNGTLLPGEGTSSMLYPNRLAFALDLLAASGIAWVFAGIYATNHGVHALLRSVNLWQVRVHWYWFLIAVALYPSVLVVGNLIAMWAGEPVSPPRHTGAWYQLVPIMALSFAMALLYGGGLEEPGWRGFALPHLQARYRPVKASLIVAVIWAFWHWPMFWLGLYGGGPLGVFAFVLGTAPVAILFTAVFNRTGGSLPIVMLLHASVNTTPSFITATNLAVGLWMLVLIGLAILMWRAPRMFSPVIPKSIGTGRLKESLVPAVDANVVANGSTDADCPTRYLGRHL